MIVLTRLLGVLLALIISLSNNASAQDLFFAGFSLIGDQQHNQQRYPVATELLFKRSASGRSVLDEALQNELKHLKRDDLNLRLDLGKVGSGNELALSFALTEESIEEVIEGAGYYSLYHVIGQILVFDFEEKKVIASFPTKTKHQDFTKQRKTPEEHKKVFKEIYLNPNFKAMIFKEWVRRLENVTIKPKYKNYLKVRHIELGEKDVNAIPKSLRGMGAYASQMAQTFEAFMTKAHNVPLIPYTGGQAIGKNMVARFSSGTSYQLKLPEADYVMDLLIRPFKSKKIQSEHGSGWDYAFGAFITLKVEQPDTHREYLHSKFKNINFVSVSKSDNVKINYASAYQTSLRTLFSKFAMSTAGNDELVLKEMTKSPDIMEQIANFKKVIEKCR